MNERKTGPWKESVEGALVLAACFLESYPRLDQAYLFASGRLHLWSDYPAALGEADLRRIDGYLRYRIGAVAEQAVFLREAHKVLADHRRVVPCNEAGQTVTLPDIGAPREGKGLRYKLLGGEPRDQLDSLLAGLRDRAQRDHAPQLPAENGQWDLRLRKRGNPRTFRIPRAAVAEFSRATGLPWPAVTTTPSPGRVCLDREAMIRTARLLDHQGEGRANRQATLEEQFFADLRAGVDGEAIGNRIDLTPGSLQLLSSPTGSGKSTFSLLAAIQLAEAGIPVALVVPGVVESFRTAHTLERQLGHLGLERQVAVINGNRNRLRHVGEVLADPAEHPDFQAWVARRVGYTCRLAPFEENPEAPFPPGREPCFQLNDSHSGEPRPCPFAAGCGKFRGAREGAEADILVTNTHAFLMGGLGLPVALDDDPPRDNRRIFDLVLHRYPVVFFDEVDQVLNATITAQIGNLPISRDEQGTPSHLARLRGELENTPPARLPLSHDDIQRTTQAITDLVTPANDLVGAILQGQELDTSRSPMHWIRQFDGYLNEQLFDPEEEPTPGGVNGLLDREKALPTRRLAGLRDILDQWRLGRLDDANTISGFRQKVLQYLQAHWSFQTPAETNLTAQRLVLRTVLSNLQGNFRYLRTVIHALADWDVPYAGTVRSQLEGTDLWSTNPVGPLGRRVLGFEVPRQGKWAAGSGKGVLSATQMVGDPHHFLNQLGGQIARAITGSERVVLGQSATAFFPEAILAHCPGEIRLAHPDPPEGSPIRIRSCRVLDEETGEGLALSGITDIDQRLSQARRLGAGLARSYLVDHLVGLADSAGTVGQGRTLLVTGSYAEAAQVADGVREILGSRAVLHLVTDDETSEGHPAQAVPRQSVERIPQEWPEARLLVAPLLAIARGINIVEPHTGRAAFQSLFLMTRPVPPTHDPGRALAFATSALFDKPVSPTDAAGIPAALQEEHKRANRNLELHHQRGDQFFSALPAPIQRAAFCDTLVELNQLIGRLRRGGTRAEVFLVDNAFYGENGGIGWGELVDRTLDYWEKTGVLADMEWLHGALLQALRAFAADRRARDYVDPWEEDHEPD